MKKSDKKLLLIAGAAAVAGYFLLRKGEEAISGVAGPLAGFAGSVAALPGAIADLTPGIQTGAAGITGGIIDVIGAAGTGAVGGVVGSIAGGFEDLTRPLPQPLRTYEPVLEARPILTEATAVVPGTDFPISPQQLAYSENIGVPIITVEQYEAPDPAQPVSYQVGGQPVQPVSYQVGGQPTPSRQAFNFLFPGLLGKV